MLLLTKAKRPLKFKMLCGFNKHAVKLSSGGTIRRELDFQTRVRILASTSIPVGNVGDEKKTETTEDVLSGR